MSEQYPECCCPSPDGIVCVAIRYNQAIEDVDEPCECHCHFLAERRFGQHEDDFSFDGEDAPDGFDDNGNRHNEMWNSPDGEDIPVLESRAIRWARHREYGFSGSDSLSLNAPWKRKEPPHE